MANTTENDRKLLRLRVALAFASFVGLFALLLFESAGRLDWATGWLYLAILTLTMAVNYAYLSHKNPEVIEHRMRLGKDTEAWDKVWMVVFAPIFTAVYVLAALDAGRFGWSDMSSWYWPVGLVLYLAGTAMLTWSMAVNPFFEKTVRIQTERGQRVIDTGPYRFVRHPGYVGLFGWLVSAPLMLGSWWAFLPAVLTGAAVVARTALEDRTLRDGLPGYTDYTARVRYRLVPGIW